MRLLGPVDKQRLAPVPSDLLTLEAVVSGNIMALVQSFIPGIGAQQPGGPYHAVLGVRNVDAPYDVRNGQVEFRAGLLAIDPVLHRRLAESGNARGVGSGQSQYAARRRRRRPHGADVGPPARADHGRRAAPRRAGRYLAAATDRRCGAARAALAARRRRNAIEAQRLQQFARLFTARNITLGNTHFLHLLTTQLGVAPERALEVAEDLLDAKLVSPVGGHYELVKPEGRFPFWTSTALTNDQRGGLLGGVPEGFRSPPLDWFRGLEAELSVEQAKLSVDAQVLMQRGLPRVAK